MSEPIHNTLNELRRLESAFKTVAPTPYGVKEYLVEQAFHAALHDAADDRLDAAESAELVRVALGAATMAEALEIASGLREQAERAGRYKAALELIADHGGKTVFGPDTPISCNGSWCADQARSALTKETL